MRPSVIIAICAGAVLAVSAGVKLVDHSTRDARHQAKEVETCRLASTYKTEVPELYRLVRWRCGI